MLESLGVRELRGLCFASVELICNVLDNISTGNNSII